MLHKNLPFIPIMVFAITSFSCVVQEYLISLNAIQKNLLSNKSPYFTIYCPALSFVSVCVLSSYFYYDVFPEQTGYLQMADTQIPVTQEDPIWKDITPKEPWLSSFFMMCCKNSLKDNWSIQYIAFGTTGRPDILN